MPVGQLEFRLYSKRFGLELFKVDLWQFTSDIFLFQLPFKRTDILIEKKTNLCDKKHVHQHLISSSARLRHMDRWETAWRRTIFGDLLDWVPFFLSYPEWLRHSRTLAMTASFRVGHLLRVSAGSLTVGSSKGSLMQKQETQSELKSINLGR